MKESRYKIKSELNTTIALITDTHNKKAEVALHSLQRVAPDLIAIAGDFVLGHRPQRRGSLLNCSMVEHQKNVLPFLSSCMAIAPTYVSLGNHEAFLRDDDLEMIRATGIVLLDNTFVRVNRNLLIGGLSAGHVVDYREYRVRYYQENGDAIRYPSRSNKELPKWYDVDDSWLSEFEKQEGYKILLSHHPEYWSLRKPKLCERKIDLVLSGHAHGGQIRIFGKGLYAPGQGFFPEYTKGMWMGKHGWLVVSTGLANTSSMVPRLFNPTEVVYVELKP